MTSGGGTEHGPRRHNDLCTRRWRFCLVLGFGTILSGFWFILHVRLTSIHERDAGIVNLTGSLRYYTQRVATAFVAAKYLPAQYHVEDPFAELDRTLSALLGQPSPGSVSDGDVEMIDEDVKAALEAWGRIHITGLRSKYEQLAACNEWQVGEHVEHVNAAIMAVDEIVDKAESASNGRVQTLVIISISRAIVGFLWALAVAGTFGSVWRPYVETYNRLQVMEQQSASVLKAAFDAVVAVSLMPPFNVVHCSESFDHLVGQSMKGKSVLACAEGETEKQELENILSIAHKSAKQQRSWIAQVSSANWWNMFPQKPPDNMPVAAMIRSNWSCGVNEDRRTLPVEVLVVNQPDSTSDSGGSTLLVVRKAEDESLSSRGSSAEPRSAEASASVAQSRPAQPSAAPLAQVYGLMRDDSLPDGDSFIEGALPMVPSQRVAMAYRLANVGSSVGSTSSTVTHQGPVIRALSLRSAEEDTPPPTIAAGHFEVPRGPHGQLADELRPRGQLTDEFIVQVEEAVQRLESAEERTDGASDATPPMRFGM